MHLGAARSSLPITVTFDSQGLLPGLRQGSPDFSTDTPQSSEPVPVDFTDVIGTMSRRTASPGTSSTARPGAVALCAGGRPAVADLRKSAPPTPLRGGAWPDSIERAVDSAQTASPVHPLGEFQDVLAGSFNANYIQGLVDDAYYCRLQRRHPPRSTARRLR